jgi:hypothetical protein
MQFHWHLEARDIRHVYIRPRTPHLNGRVERSHRVDQQEFYQLLDRDGIAMTSDSLVKSFGNGRTTTITIARTGRTDAVRTAGGENESDGGTGVLTPYIMSFLSVR